MQFGKIVEGFLAIIDRYKKIYNNDDDKVESSDNSNVEDIIVEPKLTGELLGKTVINIMFELGLNLNYCVGISTNSCSVMEPTLKRTD